MLALWKACQKDTSVDGFEFYLRTRIRGSIIDEVRKQDWISRRARKQNPHLYMTSLDDLESIDHIQALRLDPIEFSDNDNDLPERVAKLPTKLRYIITRILSGALLSTLARELGLSEPRISQLKREAIAHMREQKKVRFGATAAPISFTDLTNQTSLSSRDVAIFRDYVLHGSPKNTASKFKLSRSSISEAATRACKALNLGCTPLNVPIYYAVLARADEENEPMRALPDLRTLPCLRCLSEAELDVMTALLEGRSYLEICALRRVAYRTIAVQINSAFKQLNASGTTEFRAVVAKAIVAGWKNSG